MNGPVECLKKLSCVDEKNPPQVTFLGPRDEWMKKAGKYKYLYEMDTEIAYDWLQVWVDGNQPSFKNCIIDKPRGVLPLTKCCFFHSLLWVWRILWGDGGW
jgi:hypothetical protein